MKKETQTFISYSRQDKKIAEQICRELEDRGILCWIAPRNIDVGGNWADQIVYAIENISNYILILSEYSMQSNEVLKELTLASEMKKNIYAVCVNGCEPTKGYKYHLSIAQRLNIYSDNLTQTIERLEYKVKGTKCKIATKEKKTVSEELQIVSYYELTKNRGVDKSEIAKQLISNDKKLYPNIDDDNEGDVYQWETYLSKYPQTFRYMVNNQNQIVGNWSMVAILNEDYQRAKSGQMLESELNIENTEYFMLGGVFYGYLLNLSINEEEMSPTNIRRLFESFLDQLETFADEDIYFKSWCVNVFLADHEKRYESLGFKYECDNIKSGRMYTLDLWPYPKNKIFQKRKKLKRMYEDKFRIQCRQLYNTDMMEDDMMKNIAGLIYDTDPYIYPAMFGTRENALELIPELLRNNDAMFQLDNLFVAEYDEEIVGIILWIQGEFEWSSKLLEEVSKELRIPISPYLEMVVNEYVKSYFQSEDERKISIVNLCVSEEVRTMGIGSQMMEQFVINHTNESMELCVLEDNPGAIRLYEKCGFRELKRYQGFSVDKKALVCIGMRK